LARAGSSSHCVVAFFAMRSGSAMNVPSGEKVK
jgi:hypothetical protein